MMNTKEVGYIAVAGVGLYMLYKWQTRKNMTADDKEQFFSQAQNAEQSVLNPQKLLIPTTGGVYSVDPEDLTIYQRWAITQGYYHVDKNGLFQTDLITLNPIEQFKRGWTALSSLW